MNDHPINAQRGAQVVRLASQRAQVNIGAAVEELTLAYQVEHLQMPGRASIRKLVEQARPFHRCVRKTLLHATSR
jgi:hypothetical protein